MKPNIFREHKLHMGINAYDERQPIGVYRSEVKTVGLEYEKKWKTVQLDWLIMAKGKGLNDQLDFMCSSEILTKDWNFA